MPITIIQITDTHIHDQENINFKNTSPDIYLNRIIKHAQHNFKHIDCVVVTGDLTHDGSEKSCKKLSEYLHLFNCPVYITLGNHDFTDIVNEHLLDEQISMPEQISMGCWQLLFADSHIEGEVSGYINQTTIDLLKKYLSDNSKNSILFTHHPLMPIKSSWMDEIGLKNGDDLLQQLSCHKQLSAISFGHIHQQWHKKYQHIHLFGSPSTCVQFKPLSDEFAIDDIDPGYRVFTLNDSGTFETEVIRCSMR
jgi:3',5'-cyclic-AMP phosphodiesterase